MNYGQTVLEIDLRALAHNFEVIRSKIAPKVKIMAVVKAFGYGSDAVVIAKQLELLQVDYFAVAYSPEGVALRKAGIKTRIMVLHPQAVNFELLTSYDLEPSLYNTTILDEFLAYITSAKNARNTPFPIHLKFNTGLNRIGFDTEDALSIGRKVKVVPAIKVISLLSHLAASEDLTARQFTNSQIQKFKTTAKKIATILGYTPMLHQCNTSGIFNYPEAYFDMVRTGIGLYGFGNDTNYDKELQPVVALTSVISQINTVKVGESVGYNQAFTAKSPTMTATIPLGHADGIGRHYGNGKGFVYIHNQKAPIVGNVCMDMLMVDITQIPCKVGDQVIVFDGKHTANELAEAAGTISYELITGISSRIRRVIIE